MNNKLLMDYDIGDNGLHDKESDDSANNDSTDEDAEDKMEKRAEELEKQIFESKYAYDAHAELVKIYQKLLDLTSMRCAYQRFAELFPLTDKIWLEWIKNEITLATSRAEKKNVLDLFDKAVKDYLSIDLWLEYVQYCIGNCTAEETRAIFESAILAGGLHIAKGSLIWDAYREFELAHLSLATDKTSELWQQQANRVAECFKRQLAVPLLDIHITYVEWKDWTNNSDLPADFINPEPVEWAYKNASKLLEIYKTHEDKLLTAENRWETYRNYEKDIKQPTHVICLYERAAAELSLSTDVWLQYCRYLQKLNMPAIQVVTRALRNCPWSETLWIFQIREMEHRKCDFDEITKCLENGLESILPARGLDLWLCYLEYVHHDNKLSIPKLNQVFMQATDHIGTEGDPSSMINRFNARILASREDVDGARHIWADILKFAQKGVASAWLEYIVLERNKGTPDQIRRAFQRAIISVKDWPQSVVEEWLMYERECGTLETMLKCIEKCKNVPKQIVDYNDEGMDATQETTSRNGKRKHLDNSKVTVEEKRKKIGHASTSKTEFTEKGKFANLNKKIEIKPQLDIQSLDPDTTVFLSNMSSFVQESHLIKMFPTAKRIDLIRDLQGKSRGHGYMQLPSPSDVVPMLARDREPIEGRPIFISRFRPDRTERKPQFSRDIEENKLFVKGLPYDITQEQMDDIFQKFGEAKIRLVLQRSGRPKGLAYVEYPTKEEAAAALEATDKMEFAHGPLSVAISAPPSKMGNDFSMPRRSTNMPARGRLQIPLIPRALSIKPSASDAASTSSSAAAPTASAAAPKSNEDFRNMILGKK